MRNVTLPLMGLAVLAALPGCQVQHTTVLEASSASAGGAMPPPAPARRAPQRSPCTAPNGSGPFERLSNPVYNPPLALPDRATAEHVSGCAGVRFRIDADGKPRDMALLTEYPLGYGFGQKALDKISAMRWVAKDDLSWRFLIINEIQPPSG